MVSSLERFTLERYPYNPILSVRAGKLSGFESGSIFNPTVVFESNSTNMYRMAVRVTDGTPSDFNTPGKYNSSIVYAESVDGINFAPTRQIIAPDTVYEQIKGCEDPRVTKIGDEYFLHYTAVGGKVGDEVVRIALATSCDFKSWEKHGVVGPPVSSKAGTAFSEPIEGKYVMFLTIEPDSKDSRIIQAKFDSLEDMKSPPSGFWENTLNNLDDHTVFRPPRNAFRGPEVGAPPIKTEDGWLFIYCGANTTSRPEWTINAALLDLHDPQKILAEIEEPILIPETDEEINGIICPNCVFPEGAVISHNGEFDELKVYYGSSDEGCCLATCRYDELKERFKIN